MMGPGKNTIVPHSRKFLKHRFFRKSHSRFFCRLSGNNHQLQCKTLSEVAMKAVPVVIGCLFLLSGCLPPQPGHVAHAEYRPAPVRHGVRPAPRPVPRPEVHKPVPAPRPEVHKQAPAPRPNTHVTPSRPDRGQSGPSMQRPPSPQKSHAGTPKAPGGREPGGPAPRR